MADLSCTIAGIKSINPFWLASAPPTDKKYNVVRAFEAGWGGVVWKTLGEDPPVINVSSRYGVSTGPDGKMLGINNIELISDRPLHVNLREIRECKDAWPDRVIVGSMMAVVEEQAWKTLAKKIVAAGVDGLELNLGCPHGMCERGMGSAIGQVPEMVENVTRWVKDVVDVPVIVKLTPNITNILWSAEAAKAGGADAVALINTVNSIVSVDLDAMAPTPLVDGQGTHGGYCGPAVKPIALNMVAEIARNPATADVQISAIGGISTWRDAAEFIVLGANGLQVCTAAMVYGFRIVEDMKDGLSRWMDEKGFTSIDELHRQAVGNVVDWNALNMNFDSKAVIDTSTCIACGRCYIACEDTSHQAISMTREDQKNVYEVVTEDCVGCNLCAIVCPVDGCIAMLKIENNKPHLTWPDHPANPSANRVGE